MHVAVDAHNLVADRRGIGRYARAVLSRAMREPGVSWTLVVRRFFPNRRALQEAVGDAGFTLSRGVPRSCDVVWCPWNGTFLETRAPIVATVHDCTPFAYPVPDARKRAREQAPFLRTAALARHLLVQSAYTASEVERWLRIDATRITVAPLAADAAFTPGTYDGLPATLLGRRYILCVGAHDERKNTPTLVNAFERAFSPGSMTLAFTHAPPRLPRDAIVVEAVSDRILAALYRAATVVAVPSLSEGFGLPLLEALACAAPVLAARVSALPEIGGDAVCWIDDPLDIDAWAAALQAIASDEHERVRRAALGPPQAATFSWDRCTAQTLAALRAALTA